MQTKAPPPRTIRLTTDPLFSHRLVLTTLIQFQQTASLLHYEKSGQWLHFIRINKTKDRTRHHFICSYKSKDSARFRFIYSNKTKARARICVNKTKASLRLRGKNIIFAFTPNFSSLFATTVKNCFILACFSRSKVLNQVGAYR